MCRPLAVELDDDEPDALLVDTCVPDVLLAPLPIAVAVLLVVRTWVSDDVPVPSPVAPLGEICNPSAVSPGVAEPLACAVLLLL